MKMRHIISEIVDMFWWIAPAIAVVLLLAAFTLLGHVIPICK